MTRFISRVALLPLALLLIAAAPLVDPPAVDVPATISQKEAMGILRKTLILRDWALVKESANEVDARLNVRTHSITVRYTLSGNAIGFKYLDSDNMDYKVDRKGNPVIHRKYAGWMANVAAALRRELQLATLEKTP
jgi:hypothetical protein